MAKKKTEQQTEVSSSNNSEFDEFFLKLQKNKIDPSNRKYIKTGFSVIDNVLTEGKGLPLGSYIEISSKSGCGKCVTGDSIVFVDGKFKRIEDDIESVGFTESNEHSEIMSRYGNVHFSHRYKEHVSNVITISDVHGNKITCTPVHPLLVKNEEGNTEWVKAQDIKLKDKVMMASPYVRTSDAIKNRETFMSYLEGYDLLKSKQIWKYGFMLDVSQQNVDAICSELEHNGIKKSDNFDEYEYTERNLDQYKLYIHQKEGKDDKVYVRIDLNDSDFQKHIASVTKEYKKVFYREMSRDELIAKIAGIVDSVGNITFNSKEIINKKISLFATEKQDICDMQAMLAMLGVVGHQSIVNNCKYPYCLNLTLTSSIVLANLIEPYLLIKKNDLKRFLEETQTEQLHLTNHLKVAEICTEARDCFVYDYSVPERHEFIANGIVSHNTTMILNISKRLCEQGYTVVYIDAEEAVTDNIMSKTGLLPYLGDLFRLAPISSFNKVGELLDIAVKNENVKLIVIDSLTFLTPDELTEAGKKISDGQIGIQSRYTGNLLKRYRDRIINKEKSVIFINQMRIKMSGYGFIANEEPAGGNAQQFAMDIRLKMETPSKGKIYSSDDKKQQIGMYNEIWAIKNKYCTPFKRYNIKLMLGTGIDESQDYAKWLIDNGVVEVKGCGNYTITWGGKEIKIKGVQAYEQWIKDNEEEVSEFIEENGGLIPSQVESINEDDDYAEEENF